MRKSPFVISAVGVFLVAFLAVVQAQNISTLAGGGPTNLSVKNSGIGTPWAVVQDASGNTFISDNLSSRVFKVDGSGKITVVTGTIVANYNGDNHPATVASINSPQGIAIDSSNGALYIADTGNNVIRVVNTSSNQITLGGQAIPAGFIETLAGTGFPGYSGPAPVAATTAQLNSPSGIWLDAAGNVYLADTNNNVIEVINTTTSTITLAGVSIPSGDIATIAGNNVGTFGGDGGLATSASINHPLGVFVNATGTVFIADTLNNRIRAVNPLPSGSITVANIVIPAGDINTVAGNGTEGYAGDGVLHGAISAELNHPSAVASDGVSDSSSLYIADGDNLPAPPPPVTSNEVIRLLDSAGTISTFAGTAGVQCSNFNTPCGDGGVATSANLWAPTGVFVEAGGNLLIADQNDDAIREVSSGKIQTAMGVLLTTSYAPYPVNLTSAATDAELRRPAGVASDAAGNVYIADSFNNAIRKVDGSGTISTIVGNGFGCNTLTCGDAGPAGAATVTVPFDIAFDKNGNLYIADTGDNVIRVVNNQSIAITIAGQLIQPGFIRVIAGLGTACAATPCGDGGASTSAELNSPEGVFVDKAGTIFIADTNDNAIRVVNPTTSAITVAGVPVPAGAIVTVAGVDDPTTTCAVGTAACGDGGAATSAQLSGPGGVGLDSLGNIYIADTVDNRVRVVDATTGIISAFAGTGAPCVNNCLNNGPATLALLDAPQNLFVDFAGNVFIADSFDFEIREVTKSNGDIQGVAGDETRGFSGDNGPATIAQLGAPFGVSADPSGSLLIADLLEWRVRKVPGLAITAPDASLSPSSVSFPAQALKTKSAPIPVTLSNIGNGTNLNITKVAISGANQADFAQTNNCVAVPGPGSCTINVTITPSAAGTRNAVLMVTDDASGSPQAIDLSGVGADFTLPKTGTLSNPTVSAGGSATATITVTPGGGLNATIDLTCAVTPATTKPPTCSLNPTSLAPGSTKSTLTVSTVATSAALVAPGIVRRSVSMYAVWLLLPGMLLSTAGLGASRRRKLLSYLLLFCALTGCLFLIACGGGGSSGGGGGGGGGGTTGTTAGSYTVTVTARTSTTTASQTFPITVQ